MTSDVVIIGVTAFAAAFVTGGLGYGFSSITVPVALQFHPSRVLNPALVISELGLNGYATWVNRRALSRVLPRVVWMLVGLLPGVALGAWLLGTLSSVVVKLATYGLLAPLIVLQLARVLRPLPLRKSVSLPFGLGVGFLYAVTTISGPPLALLLNNQGFAKEDFRAAIASFRLSETVLTTVAYAQLGLFQAASGTLVLCMVPGILVGLPLGAFAIRHMNAERFRRVCLIFDLCLVCFGLVRAVVELMG